jgi:hypothetical protein
MDDETFRMIEERAAEAKSLHPALEEQSFLRELAEAVPALAALLREHVNDHNGEILAHPFMSEVASWVTERFVEGREHGEVPSEVTRVLTFLEERYVVRQAGVSNLIEVSFLEMLPWYEEDAGVDIAEVLPPKLAQTLAEMKRAGFGYFYVPRPDQEGT